MKRLDWTRLAKIESKAPAPFQPMTVRWTIYEPNILPNGTWGPPKNLGVCQETHVTQEGTHTVRFAGPWDNDTNENGAPAETDAPFLCPDRAS